MSATSEVLFERIHTLSTQIEAADAAGVDTAVMKDQLNTLREQYTRAQRVLTENRKTLLTG